MPQNSVAKDTTRRIAPLLYGHKIKEFAVTRLPKIHLKISLCMTKMSFQSLVFTLLSLAYLIFPSNTGAQTTLSASVIEMIPRRVSITDSLFVKTVISLNPNSYLDNVQVIIDESTEILDERSIHPRSFNETPVQYTRVFAERGKQSLEVLYWPYFLKNGKINRIDKVRIRAQKRQGPGAAKKADNYPASSVLASGRWFKYRLSVSGVYKVTYNTLAEQGAIAGPVASDEVRWFGNGTGMLTFENDQYRPNDLLQVPVKMMDGGDGQFGPGDYFLFYGQGPTRWNKNASKGMLQHRLHLYDDFSYYFFSVQSTGTAERIPTEPTPDNSDNWPVVDFYTYAAYHDLENENLIKSGQRLYGEVFDFTTRHTVNFAFPPLKTGEVDMWITAAGSSSGSASSMDVTAGQKGTTLTFSSTGQYDVVSRSSRIFSTENVDGALTVDMKYNKPNNSAKAYLDFVIVNAQALLQPQNGQSGLFLMDVDNWPDDSVRLSFFGMGQDWSVWDVTDHNAVSELDPEWNGASGSAGYVGNGLRKMVAFRGSSFPAPQWVGQVENQDLHSLPQVDYVMVVPEQFWEQAERLKTFHESQGLSVAMIEPGKLYNEFSGGARDATAIKELMRMLYLRAEGVESEMPRYLLLFGDGSYYNKRDDEGNSNVLPTYYNANSERLTNSYITDDYFGWLDDTEGNDPRDLLDIGIGRFPVNTVKEARVVVDKTLRYAKSAENGGFGSWRNLVSFVTDDRDGSNLPNENHMEQAETLSKLMEDLYPAYLPDKIYLDAFQQRTTPGGERYPEAANRIRERVEDGALIVNYTGHGGELGWAHERILDVPTINGWTNSNALTLFVTATCEFSRFDDPDRISAGEYTLLNEKGGAVALFTTTRLVYSSGNFNLNKRFYNYALPSAQYPDLRLGDIIRLTKVETAQSVSGDDNHLNFSLLGDPALRLAYPEYNVATTHINGVPVENWNDTLHALSRVTIEGVVTDAQGQTLQDFNGQVEALVLDKKSDLQTLSNDGGTPLKYQAWSSVLYKGLAEVVNGEFSYTFIVPRDINFSLGNGRVNYYAQSELHDAQGMFDELLVGTSSGEPLDDDKGPDIDLYMNDTDFESGSITSEDPTILAFLFDESGINTTGAGIGHDITAVVDARTEQAIVLNKYYTADLNSYQSGKVLYDLSGVSEGRHTLTLTAWDINNNPAEASIDFVVASSQEAVIQNLINFPNPMHDQTTFRFDHNLGGEEMQVKLLIYDRMGRKIYERLESFTDEGFRSTDITWDGKLSNGQNISSGTYVYSLEITTSGGQTLQKGSTLVVLK